MSKNKEEGMLPLIFARRTSTDDEGYQSSNCPKQFCILCYHWTIKKALFFSGSTRSYASLIPKKQIFLLTCFKKLVHLILIKIFAPNFLRSVRMTRLSN